MIVMCLEYTKKHTKMSRQVCNTKKRNCSCPNKWPNIKKHQIVTLTIYIDKTPKIETKHQIDMDKTCQCHCNKQHHNMSPKEQDTRVSKYHINITHERVLHQHPITNRKKKDQLYHNHIPPDWKNKSKLTTTTTTTKTKKFLKQHHNRI